MTREIERSGSSVKTGILFIWFTKSRYLRHKAGIKKILFLLTEDKPYITVEGHCHG